MIYLKHLFLKEGIYLFAFSVKTISEVHLPFKIEKIRSSHSEVFLGKGVLKICRKYT